jgi:predicted glycoside hydrolase/deacetylase ChbG (UPF0249 family)
MNSADAASAPTPVSSGQRWLVVNADDFGLSSGVNAGIIAAHERGIVTSASLMVRGPAAGEAARYAASNRRLSLGLHVDLGEWQCIAGNWQELYRVVPLDDAAAATAEVRRQLHAFRDLVGGDPTHVDSHQHVHRGEPVRTAVAELAAELRVPVRDFTPGLHFCGGFYGQAAHGEPWHEGVSRGNLVRLLEELPVGFTELSCHPGLDDELPTMYCLERRLEVEVLCDPQIAAAVRRLGIRLITFAEYRAMSEPAHDP